MKNNTLNWIWSAAGRQRRQMLFLALLQCAVGAAAVASAWCLRSLIDAATGGNRPGLTAAAWLFCAVVAARIACAAAGRALGERCRASLENRLKGRLFSVLLRGDYAAVRAKHSEEWMSRLTTDTETVSEGFAGILPTIAGAAVKLIGAVILIALFSPKLLLLVIPCGVLTFLFGTGFRNRLKRLHKAIRDRDGALRTVLAESLRNLLTVKSFGAEDAETQNAETYMEAHKTARLRRNAFANFCSTGLTVLVNGAYLVCAVWCAFAIADNRISYGTCAALLQLVGQIQTPFQSLSGVFSRFFSMTASAERLMEAETIAPESIASSEPAADFTRFGMKNISFRYRDAAGERQALTDFSLSVGRGEFVALRGASGAGKSTVLKLLLCVFRPDGGELYLDDQPLTAAHRSLFAYVPQGSSIWRGTVREAVTFGRPCDDARLARALEAACAAEFVAAMPQGADTPLMEAGKGLSEGQQQRLAIARAVYSERPVLLLDEATSALDEATEARVLAALRALPDRTVIAVTHRSSALAVCDREAEL